MKAFRVVSARENSESKTDCIPGETAEISATIEDAKYAGVVGPIPSPFNSPGHKTDGSWCMTTDY